MEQVSNRHLGTDRRYPQGLSPAQSALPLEDHRMVARVTTQPGLRILGSRLWVLIRTTRESSLQTRGSPLRSPQRLHRTL